ncbi:hypothetical protein ACLOJK_038836 [Asimina triloba]
MLSSVGPITGCTTHPSPITSPSYRRNRSPPLNTARIASTRIHHLRQRPLLHAPPCSLATAHYRRPHACTVKLSSPARCQHWQRRRRPPFLH